MYHTQSHTCHNIFRGGGNWRSGSGFPLGLLPSFLGSHRPGWQRWRPSMQSSEHLFTPELKYCFLTVHHGTLGPNTSKSRQTLFKKILNKMTSRVYCTSYLQKDININSNQNWRESSFVTGHRGTCFPSATHSLQNSVHGGNEHNKIVDSGVKVIPTGHAWTKHPMIRLIQPCGCNCSLLKRRNTISSHDELKMTKRFNGGRKGVPLPYHTHTPRKACEFLTPCVKLYRNRREHHGVPTIVTWAWVVLRVCMGVVF